jgi:DtxR family Mn-dependent transcriptional regulator
LWIAAGSIVAVEEGFHPPVEEYLETVHSLTEEGTPVIQARIAERLGRSAPSVSEMLDRLEDEGYVRRAGRVVELTDTGSVVAEKVVRRHRLAERLLVDVIGLEWHKVHLEAGRWEHVISDDVERRLVQLLGDPATCPHGNPIPGSSSVAAPAAQTPLVDVQSGQTVRLERISEDVELDTSLLSYLSQHGFVPGASAVVSSRSPDGTLVLALDSGATVAFGPGLAGRLHVSVG